MIGPTRMKKIDLGDQNFSDRPDQSWRPAMPSVYRSLLVNSRVSDSRRTWIVVA